MSVKDNFYIIHEDYEKEIPPDVLFNSKLDEALHLDVDTIIIEPSQLGNRTLTWLTLAKYLRRFASAFGIASLLTGKLCHNISVNYEPFIVCGALNFSLGTFYFIAFDSDPCIKYKVQDHTQQLATCVPREQIRTSKPVILVKNGAYKVTNLFHYSVFSISLTYLTYKCFRIFLSHN